MTLTTFRLDHSYDGTEFSGWAAQPGERTVQGELTRSLDKLFPDAPQLTVAGRTDAGVHAWNQVASFSTEGSGPEDLLHAINGTTPRDLTVHRAVVVEPGFDARRDAVSRTYCYRVLVSAAPSPLELRYALHWPYEFDLTLLGRAAESLLGQHDFTAFTPTQTDHVRFEREVSRCEWVVAQNRGPGQGSGEVHELWIEADSFMRSMVRVLVGTLLEVGCRRRSQDEFEALLQGAPRDQAGETAPAHGLHLASVRYRSDEA